MISILVLSHIVNDDNKHCRKTCQPGLCVLGASLSSQANLLKGQPKWPAYRPCPACCPCPDIAPAQLIALPRYCPCPAYCPAQHAAPIQPTAPGKHYAPLGSILPLPSCFHGIPVAMPKAHHANIDRVLAGEFSFLYSLIKLFCRLCQQLSLSDPHVVCVSSACDISACFLALLCYLLRSCLHCLLRV